MKRSDMKMIADVMQRALTVLNDSRANAPGNTLKLREEMRAALAFVETAATGEPKP